MINLQRILAAAKVTCVGAFSLLAVSCGFEGSQYTEDGRLIITYWEKWTGFEEEAMISIVDKYNASQDDVFVKFISHSQIDQKLLLATAGGNPPDVAGFWSHSLVSYAEKGVLYPMDGFMERDGLKREDYIPSIIDCCTYRDFVWGMPSTPATVALHYNEDILEEVGVGANNPPETLKEMREVSELINTRDEDGSYSRMGFLPTDPGWWGPFWGYWFGGELISEDGREITCDSPENIEAFKWFRTWSQDFDRKEVKKFEGAHRGLFASPSNSFMSGRIGMKLQGVWMANFIEEFGDDMNWAVTPMPAADDVTGGPATVVEVDMLVIPRGAKHVEEAWDFIKYVQQQENMEQLCSLQRKFSPLQNVSEEFISEHQNPYIDVFRNLAESPNARAVPKTPVWTEYRDELAAAISVMWQNPESEISTEEILGNVKRRMQPKLDIAWERWDAVGDQRLTEWSQL